MKNNLTGGLQYCKMCQNTTHPEDDCFPFCEEHKSALPAYLQYQKEHEDMVEINTELYEK